MKIRNIESNCLNQIEEISNAEASQINGGVSVESVRELGLASIGFKSQSEQINSTLKSIGESRPLNRKQ